MKDITLKIIGKQLVGGEQEEQMEFVTEGQLFEKSGATWIIYDESEFSGFPGCKTMLKLTGDTVRMKRVGKSVGYGTEIFFEKGKRFQSNYQTPYGAMEMEVLTKDIVNHLSEEGFGTINIDYHVNLNGIAEGRNLLKIEVLQ